MDWKKFALAVVVIYLVLFGLDFVIHSMWLGPVYASLPDSWRPMDQMEQKMWIMWVASLLFTVMFVYVYTRGMENKPWLGQGIRYGVLITLLASIPTVLSQYVVFRIPYTLAIKWMASGAVELILAGVIVAFICKKEAA